MNLIRLTCCPNVPTAIHIGIFSRFPSSGTDPRKGWRTPLNKNRYSEQRDAETGLSYFGARYSTSFRDVSWQRPQASLGALLLKRYYDADLTTGWLSVDPMADKYPSTSPYAYCAWNPVKLVDPDGREWESQEDTPGSYRVETRAIFGDVHQSWNLKIFKTRPLQ